MKIRYRKSYVVFTFKKPVEVVVFGFLGFGKVEVHVHGCPKLWYMDFAMKPFAIYIYILCTKVWGCIEPYMVSDPFVKEAGVLCLLLFHKSPF